MKTTHLKPTTPPNWPASLAVGLFVGSVLLLVFYGLIHR